jgi:hypothetical protein
LKGKYQKDDELRGVQKKVLATFGGRTSALLVERRKKKGALESILHG